MRWHEKASILFLHVCCGHVGIYIHMYNLVLWPCLASLGFCTITRAILIIPKLNLTAERSHGDDSQSEWQTNERRHTVSVCASNR